MKYALLMLFLGAGLAMVLSPTKSMDQAAKRRRWIRAGVVLLIAVVLLFSRF